MSYWMFFSQYKEAAVWQTQRRVAQRSRILLGQQLDDLFDVVIGFGNGTDVGDLSLSSNREQAVQRLVRDRIEPPPMTMDSHRPFG